MANWYQMHERGAGRVRMEFLWWIYRLCGLRVLKWFVGLISTFIAIGARGGRIASKKYKSVLNAYETKNKCRVSRFSSFAHIRAFAYSAVDKMSAICDKKTPIRFEINDDADWQELQKNLSANQGVFFICSHLGNIEALCAIPNAADKKMHAFMNVEQNAVFRSFIERHAKYKNTVIHPTEDIDVAMAGEIYDALARGELVMMAGDRQSPNAPGKTIKSKCLGHGCALPAGVFRFARACNCPVFAIANMNVGGAKYRVFVRQIDTKNLDKMASEYMGFIEKLILQYPTQWFNFFDFFEC